MRILGPETAKSNDKRASFTGFYDQYMNGIGLDIGYRGSVVNAEPVLETAIGIELDYPGYDGKTLPFQTESQDYVFSSHSLEHISDWKSAIQEWFRVLKVGGNLILIVPHAALYEKKQIPPSRWNEDHKRFYMPDDLLFEVRQALETNTYRLRHCRDNDDYFNYDIPPDKHSDGCYEIECVIQKIKKPTWNIE